MLNDVVVIAAFYDTLANRRIWILREIVADHLQAEWALLDQLHRQLDLTCC
jgi:hypothetical protein